MELMWGSKYIAFKEVRWWVWFLIRVGIYATLFLLIVSGNRSSNQVLVGVTSGILCGDYLTWVMRKLVSLSYEGFAWEVALNIILAVFVMKFTGITIPTEGEGMALGFLAFLAIGGVKLAVFLTCDIVGKE